MGRREEVIELSPEWKVSDLLDLLESRQPLLQSLRGGYRVAVDLEMVGEDHSLHGAQEVALIPPVSGGSSPWVRLGSEPICHEQVLQAVRRPDCGAVVLFLGTVRDSHGGQPVERIDYSAYEAMAQRQLENLVQQAEQRLGVGSAACWHRTGPVGAGESSVAVAVASPHRRQAFEVGQWLIDTLKAEVPLWKKEIGPGGEVWIEGDCRIPG